MQNDFATTSKGATLKLPAPFREGGLPLFDALSARRSVREYDRRPLELEVLSTLLWCAFGINGPDGARTAPSARNAREIDIYLFLAEGHFLYDPLTHSLLKLGTKDLRALTGQQDFVAVAPAELVYVADLARMSGQDRTETRFYSAADAGAIAENVYLCCASEGLATVVRGLLDRPALAKAISLKDSQRILLAQTVGYPHAETHRHRATAISTED